MPAVVLCPDEVILTRLFFRRYVRRLAQCSRHQERVTAAATLYRRLG